MRRIALPDPLAAAARSAHTVLLVGDVDTGKTTLAAALAAAAIALGRRVAVVDADIGQSDIGPPAAVGMGRPAGAIRSLGEVALEAAAFVGATSATVFPRDHVDSTRRMALAARSGGADLVIVDTTGFVRGPEAARLKAAKAAAIAPDLVVAIQRAAECRGVLRAVRAAAACAVAELAVDRGVRSKPPAERAAHRAAQFAAALQGAREVRVSLGRAVWAGAGALAGIPCPEALEAARASGVGAIHAALRDDRIALIVPAPIPQDVEARMRAALPRRRVDIVLAAGYNNLLVGIETPDRELLALGVCTGLDAQAAEAVLWTPCRHPEHAAAVRAGAIRLAPDGTQTGTVRTGEI